jgi:hypothetical protein
MSSETPGRVAAEAQREVLRALAEWRTRPGVGRRRAIAVSSASTTRSASRSGRIDQPTIRRL